MAIAFRSAGTRSAISSTSSRVLSNATGVLVDDILIAPIFLNGAQQTITPPSGWALFASLPIQASNHGLQIFWKRAVSADTTATDYTFSWPTAEYNEGQIFAYSGCTTTGTPIEASPSSAFNNTSDTLTAAVSFTTTGADRWLIHGATHWAGGSSTPSTGFTKRSTGAEDLIWSDKVQASAGSSGTVQASFAPSSDKTTAWLGALIPAGGSDPSATLAASLPALTASLVADVDVAATLAGTLPTLAASLVGDVDIAAAIAGSMPSLAASLGGTVATLAWRLIAARTQEKWQVSGGLTTQYTHESTVFGDNTTLYTSYDGGDPRIEDAVHVWRGGYINTTTDPAIRALWLANGFTVEEVA